ncbi:MAG: hypothetical protein KJO54_01605 [Gammaproteobacteria bacterium]|nr:hypothetical protein [Gammaproteobacteria bacterium]NNF60813.1 hypothetical protein [Gammaproteobacteria bacterium]
MIRPAFLLLLFFALHAALAGVHDDIGFTRLKNELGDKLPTGAGILIGQVESPLGVDHDNKEATLKVNTWVPNPKASGLRDVAIVNYREASEGVYSGHATAVARRLAGSGRNQGLVSDLAELRVYSTGHYLGGALLQTRRAGAPMAIPLRLINHSWAGNGRNSEILRRSDWLTEKDEVIQVVGVSNAKDKVNTSYMAAAVNAIVVGRSDANHSVGTPAIDDIYLSGRARPHLVAPLKTGSAAAPTVSSAVVLLLEVAANPALSSRAQPFINRGGIQIYDAGRSEVMRAVLMAGATRKTRNSSHGDIAGYRDVAENRMPNGLDRRYGAGQLDIYNAWKILTAGEQENVSRPCGFDYEPALAAGGVRDYELPMSGAGGQLAATVSWNLLFPAARGDNIDLSARLNRLELSLIEVSGDGERVVRESASPADTTQSLYETLQPDTAYLLRVTRADAAAGSQDFALAWHVISNEAP